MHVYTNLVRTRFTILDHKYTSLGMELVGGIPDSIGHSPLLCYTESKVHLV